MIKNKLKYFIIFIIGLVVFTSCEDKSVVKIGFLMPASVGSRWIIDEVYVSTAAEKNGVELIVRSAENDENLQLKQATELLELGVDVLIVVPINTNTSAAIVRDAHSYGVKVIAYDRLIKNSDLDYIVTFDGAQIGELMVDHAIELIPKGNYVLLWGDPGDVTAVFIKDAQEAALKAYVENGDINIVYKGYIDNWSNENSCHLMKKVLSFTDQNIDAVITSYDGLALGALKAYDEMGIDYPQVVTGQDANLEAMRAIVRGEMSFTVYIPIKEIANATVDLSVKLAKGEKVEDLETFINNGRKDVLALMLTPVAVTKNTIKSTVIADEFYTEEEIYGN